MAYEHRELRYCPYCEKYMKLVFHSEDKPYDGKYYSLWKCENEFCRKVPDYYMGVTDYNSGFGVKDFVEK